MKTHSLKLAAAGLTLSLSLGLLAVPALALEDSHAHGDLSSLQLQLNQGQKWETDAPLRQAMRDISGTVNAVLGDIHENTLDAPGYQVIVEQVNTQLAYMIENCNLEPAADEQLHIVLAQLIQGSQHIQGHDAIAQKREGAVQLVGALNAYADYFVDEAFVRPAH